MKNCNNCGNFKHLTAFSKQKTETGSYRLRAICKVCRSEERSKKHKQETEQQKLLRRNTLYKRLYGITINQYNQIFVQQNGKCLTCETPQSSLLKALVVDHCHKTKRVRGLLCSGCNLAIGNIKENPDTLVALSKYLQKAA